MIYLDTTATTNVLDLKPLHLCRHLEVLILEGPQHIMRFDDRGVEAMAQAWPHLEILKLRHPQAVAPPVVTLRTLQTLVRLCLRLDTLEIAIDASTEIPHGPSRMSRVSWVRHLNLNSSIPCDEYVRGIANFIRETFPRLNGFEASTWSESSRADTWPGVRRLVLAPE